MGDGRLRGSAVFGRGRSLEKEEPRDNLKGKDCRKDGVADLCPPQIGRTSAIFSVSEIVVYRDAATAQPTHKPRGKYRDPGGEDGGKEEEDPSTFLARILEYLETPQCAPAPCVNFWDAAHHFPLF